jgi:two-component system invasion response regulator UvrY
MEKITLLLVDDHRLLRDSWIAFFNSDSRFRVIGDTGSGAEAIEMVSKLMPSVVLLDINMSPIDGYEITQQINSKPGLSKVIGVTMYNSIHCAKRLQALGAMGYLTKNSCKEEMIKAILTVSRGHRYICEEIKDALCLMELETDEQIKLINRLSNKELAVVQEVKKGFSSREIAVVLKVKVKTVEAHRYNILKKLNLKNRASLVNLFNANGI